MQPSVYHPSAIHIHHNSTQPSNFNRLSRLGSNLGWSALGLLLRDLGSLARGCLGSTLCLLSLLLALGSGLLFLAFTDGCLSGSGSSFWSHRSSLLDHVEGCTDDSSLVLDCSAGPLLCNFLSSVLEHAMYFRDASEFLRRKNGKRTSEIPFLCCLRYRVVQAILRGFFR